jgi:hypothetical protein
MPEASGTRFYRELKKDPELSATPVFIVTAVTGFGGDAYGYEKFLSRSSLVPPPEGFYPKPIDREAFVSAVTAQLSS